MLVDIDSVPKPEPQHAVMEDVVDNVVYLRQRCFEYTLS